MHQKSDLKPPAAKSSNIPSPHPIPHAFPHPVNYPYPYPPQPYPMRQYIPPPIGYPTQVASPYPPAFTPPQPHLGFIQNYWPISYDIPQVRDESLEKTV